MKIALRNRLPNAPVTFVGRETEKGDLASAIARAPAVIVQGHPGIGRLSLVVSTLRDRFAADVERCLFVDSEGLAAGEASLEQTICRAVDTVLGRVDWRPAPGDLHAFAEALLEILEEHGLWLVVRDCDGVDEPVARKLLDAAFRHGKMSRWIIISRVEIGVAGAVGQVINVGPLQEDAARALARHAAPGKDELVVSRALGAAKGSPRRILQQLGRSEGSDGVPTLAGVPNEGRSLLEVLAVLNEALPTDVIARIVTLPPPKVLDLLERRHLLAREGERLALHREARMLGIPRSTGSTKRTEVRAHALAELAKVDDPSAGIAALQIAVDLEAPESVRQLLERLGQSMLSAGYAELLARTLPQSAEGDVAAWRARAVALADDPNLGPVDPLPLETQPQAALDRLDTVATAAPGMRIRETARTALALAAEGHLAAADRALLAIEELPAARTTHSFRRAADALAVARGQVADLVRPEPQRSSQRTPEGWEALLFAGQLEQLDRALEAPCVPAWIEARDAIVARLSLLRAAPLPPGKGAVYRVIALRHAARRGSAGDIRPATAAAPVVAVLEALLAAEAALASGAASRASEHVTAALRISARHDLVAWRFEALELAADVALIVGDDVQLSEVKDELRKQATLVRSSRWQASSALLEACTGPRGLDGRRLMQIAAVDREASPQATRRARMLLGDPAEGDAIDRAFLSAVAARGEAFRSRIVRARRPWALPIVLDEANKHVVFADRSVDLGDLALLWRCLQALAQHGGEATKDELYCEAWEEKEFHPGRHNNRLHTTINKLRGLLAPLQPAPVIVTTDSGYAFAPEQGLVWLGAPDA